MLNMDFSLPVTIDTSTSDWIASPMPGVWRKPLAREEAERGHATSIVRYDPGASFRPHNHPLGEEILVLEGTFSDETGDFSAGTYFRNPMGFIHAPFSKEGCIILVKLHQFQREDTQRLVIKTTEGKWLCAHTGTQYLPLHSFGTEQVVMVKLEAGAEGVTHQHPQGEEIYVLSGELEDSDGSYPAGTWLRRPPGSQHCPCPVKDTLLWVKSGHLAIS